MEGDFEENRLWVVEPAEIQTELLSPKAFVKSTEQRIVPVRVLNLSGHEKSSIKTQRCAVINNEPEEDQKEFVENVEK